MKPLFLMIVGLCLGATAGLVCFSIAAKFLLPLNASFAGIGDFLFYSISFAVLGAIAGLLFVVHHVKKE
jgi:hypothetical protein